MRTVALVSPFLLLFLTACGTERVVERPVIHEVVRTEWREVPIDLTASCDKQPIPDSMTYADVLESWAKDRSSLDRCNGKLTGIRSLRGEEPR